MPEAQSCSKSLEPAMTRLEKYNLFETATYYYLVGSDAREQHYKILKLDRCAVNPKSLDDVLLEDVNIYAKDEMSSMLSMINEGNKTSGGLTQVTVAYGLVGFVRFLDCYYFTLITQRKKVGSIGNNDIYAIKSAEVFAIKPREQMEFSFKNVWNNMKGKINRATVDTAESRYLGLFQFIDISKDFFFSYTYDLTHTLQFNFNVADKSFPPPPSEELFEWSRHQSQELRECLGDLSAAYWVLPIIHGSYQQRKFDMFGKTFDIALIARRSRHYAGTRYLKRGISVHGKVANDCEMEQIIQVPDGIKSTYASFVQVRGSIPTYWYQETSVTMPKPPILVNRIDPTYLATQVHFADLFTRYGAPIIALDLVKQAEKRKRECIIGKEFRQAIEVVNLTIPKPKRIRYVGLDFSRMSKAAKHANVSQSKSSRRGSTVVVGAGDEWSNFEKSLGNEVLDKPSPSSDSLDNKPGVSPQQPASSAAAPAARIDVLKELKVVSTWTLAETAFFCSSAAHVDSVKGHVSAESRRLAKVNGTMQQSGVLRTNCIDCLDRTNVGQFAAGACFLNVGLASLGLLKSPDEEPSSGVLLGLMDLYSEMGDKIALQYGGSNAHKKVSGGSKGIAQAGKSGSKPNELLTSIKRYYSNAFTDRLKQDAMNLFLGYFLPSQSDSPLWDLENDYFMHNKMLHPEQPISYKMLYDLDAFVQHHYGRGEFRDSLVGSRRESRRHKGATTDAEKEIGNTEECALVVPESTPSRDVNEGHVDVNFIEDEINDIMEHFDQMIGSYLIKAESSVRRGSSPGKYLDANNLCSMTAAEKAAVRRLERRKLSLKQKQVMLAEAYKMWWQEAIQKHYSQQQWMSLSPPEPDIVTPYFERTHETAVLTSFDEKLSEEYMYPFDATFVGLEDSGEHGALEPMVAKGRMLSTAGDVRRDSIARTLGTPLRTESIVTSQPDAGDDFQFNLSKFVLDIGKQATKAVVDGIMGRNDDDEYLKTLAEKENSRKNSVTAKKKKRFRDPTPHWKNVDGDPNSELSLRSLIDLPVSDESLRIYADSEQKYNSPEDFIYAKNIVRKKDFDQLLKCVNISDNDVYGMENLARDSIVCDVIKDGVYVGIPRTTTANEAFEKILTSLVYVEDEIIEYTRVKPAAPESKRQSFTVAESLAEPVKSAMYYADLVRSSVITSPLFSDDELLLPIASDNDTTKAARAAKNYAKSLKNVGAAAMASNKEDVAGTVTSPDGFVHRRNTIIGAPPPAHIPHDDGSDSDDDEIVRLEDVNRRDDDNILSHGSSDPLNDASKGYPTVDFAMVSEEALPSDETPNHPTTPRNAKSPGDCRERRASSILASESAAIMNNFLTTPLFEQSATSDSFFKGEKAIVEMLDIPTPAKAVLSKIAAATKLAPGLEEEIYKLIANYMFQQTMYGRAISFDRLSKRLSVLTSQADLLQYSSFYGLEDLAANLDSIMFITSSDSKGRFYELDNLRRSLELRHSKYVKDLEQLKITIGMKGKESVTLAIQSLLNKKAELMKESTALAEFIKQLNSDKSESSENEKISTEPKEWFICADSAPEEYLSKFSQVQSDLYQKKDNEYVIANTVAMMSFYSFHDRDKLGTNIWG